MTTTTISKKRSQAFITYRQLFEDSPAPKYIFDLETLEMMAVNHAALNQYGYTRDEFLALKATDIRPEEELTAFMQVLDDVEGQPYFDFGQWIHRRKNGDVFWVHIYAHGTILEGRRARMVMAIDIDQKVRAEKELQQKNAEINNILASITDGFLAVNKHWEVVYMNKAAETILQCKREDLLHRNMWSYFSDAIDSKSYIAYHRVMNEKVSVDFEEFYEPLQLWASVRAYPAAGGVAIYFIDITEQKKKREKLAHDEQNLRAIITNTKDTLWSVDRDYNIIVANEPFHNRMELVVGERVTRLQKEQFTENSFNIWDSYYRRALTGESFKIIWHEKIGARDIYEEVSFNPIINDQHVITGVNCISRDVTENYLYTKKIEAQNESLRKIAWMQSHEVRAPLANILGLVALFKQDILTEAQRAEIIDMLGKAAGQLDEVIYKITMETQA